MIAHRVAARCLTRSTNDTHVDLLTTYDYSYGGIYDAVQHIPSSFSGQIQMGTHARQEGSR